MARKCILCGSEYTYCKSCAKDAKKALWHEIYDKENCKDISKALTDYNFKRITKEEAKELLSKCDLSIELKDVYRNEINAIMAKNKKTKKQEVEVIEEIQPEQEEVLEEESIGVVITELSIRS